MTPPPATGILGLWERVAPEPPGRRASVLLSWAAPDADPSTVPAGEGNSALLRRYEQAFGASLAGVVDCPSCDELLEVDVAIPDLLGALPATAPAGVSEVYESSCEGHLVQFRVPTATDLARLPRSGLMLLAGCIAGVVAPDGASISAEGLPAAVVAAVERAMADLDPAAELQLSLACPGCGLTWSEFLDPVAFLSAEVEAQAREAVEAVHILAAAYGWSEADVLSLSPWRLRTYLEMAAR
jgi:hypothetical protein